MKREPVKDSSQIAAIGYDPDTLVLEVEFKSGGVYQYAEVPPAVHAALLSSESVGSAFAAQVRNRYRTTKLDQATGAQVPVELAKASSASRAYLRMLAKDAGLWRGDAAERIGPLWRHVIRASGRTDPGAVLVDTWIDQLFQGECSAAIDYLKTATGAGAKA